jgi:hypothetical protein
MEMDFGGEEVLGVVVNIIVFIDVFRSDLPCCAVATVQDQTNANLRAGRPDEKPEAYTRTAETAKLF